jgi:phage-related protein
VCAKSEARGAGGGGASFGGVEGAAEAEAFEIDLAERYRNSFPWMYRIWYTSSVGKSKNPQFPTGRGTPLGAFERQGKRVPAIFFRTEAGGEPVRDWLKGLPSRDDRKRIGEDIKTVEFGWPVGMPVCKPLGDGIYEVRTRLVQNRIARVLFYIDKKGRMVLLHGFIKKTRKTPDDDLEMARSNKSKHQRGLP